MTTTAPPTDALPTASTAIDALVAGTLHPAITIDWGQV